MLKKFLTPIQIILLSISIAWQQIYFPFIEEADTRFVMNLGKYILEHGFLYIDPFTIHENLQLVAQQWLSGVLFWDAYKNFGLNGLLIVDTIVSTATILIYWRLCLLVSGGNKVLSFVTSFIVGLLIASWIVPRPHILSALLLLIEVFALEKFTRTNNVKFLILLPLVSVTLVNLHAAVWLMSLVVCLPFLFVKNIRHIKFLLAAMGGIFICGLINPYGIDAMTYVFRSYGVEAISSSVPEMFTPSAHGLQGKFFYATEAFLIFSLTKFKTSWRYIFLSGGITFMAIMHMRNLVLFYLLATFPLAYVWKGTFLDKFFLPSENEQCKNRILMTLAFFLLTLTNTIIMTILINDDFGRLPGLIKVLLFALILFAFYTLVVLKFKGRIFHPAILPRKILFLSVSALIVCNIAFATFNDNSKKSYDTYTNAIKFILRNERPENIALYVKQGIGGLAGSFGIKYYIDSRSEVFLPINNGQRNIFEEYCDFTKGRINYKDFFNRYNFTHIIVTSKEPFIFDQLSADKNFRVIYESEKIEGHRLIRCKIFVPKKD